MIVKRYNWPLWWDGLRSCAMRAGFTALGTQLTALLASNGVASMGIPHLQDIGLSWKTALMQLLIQFLIHTGIATSKYISDNPDPQIIEQTIETTHITRSPSGEVTSGTSKVTTSTPISANPPATPSNLI